MAYRKRKEDAIVTEAKKRLQQMKQIDADKGNMIEYGDAVSNPLNSRLLEEKIAMYDKVITELNQLLGQADEKLNEEARLRKEIRRINAGVLQGAKAKFGPDDSIIEKLGGKRASERKRKTTKKVTTHNSS